MISPHGYFSLDFLIARPPEALAFSPLYLDF